MFKRVSTTTLPMLCTGLLLFASACDDDSEASEEGTETSESSTGTTGDSPDDGGSDATSGSDDTNDESTGGEDGQPGSTGTTGESDSSSGDEDPGEPGEVEVVDFVELERYLGTWYEIASFPSPFSGSCVGTTATYTANDDGTVGVLNRCFVGSVDGQEVEIEGYAEVVDEQTNAKLLVYFDQATPGEYWVVNLDPSEGDEPYQWAVVSNSTRTSLFILSREPQMEEALYEELVADLEERGWDVSMIEQTPQPEAD